MASNLGQHSLFGLLSAGITGPASMSFSNMLFSGITVKVGIFNSIHKSQLYSKCTHELPLHLEKGFVALTMVVWLQWYKFHCDHYHFCWKWKLGNISHAFHNYSGSTEEKPPLEFRDVLAKVHVFHQLHKMCFWRNSETSDYTMW